MKSSITRFVFSKSCVLIIILLLLLNVQHGRAQVTITTNGTGSLTTFRPGHCLITFVITNSNTSAVTLTDVGCLQSKPSGNPSNPSYTLWYHTTSLEGAPVVSTANGWVQGPTQVKPWQSGTVVNDVLTNISITIPAGATYRFALESSGGLVYGLALSPVSFSSGNITLYRGGAPYKAYSGNFPNPTGADTITGSSFIGYVRFSTGPPCNQPDVPVVAAAPPVVCAGSNTVLSITSGNLNDAAGWQWYAGSCGGTAVGTGTSVTVSPAVTTTYYVRGEGGCATAGTCAAVTVSVNPRYNDTVTATICAGQSYLFNGNALTAAGTYSATFSSAAGCDSLVTLHLAVNAPASYTVHETICAGDSYLFDGNALTTAGTYNAIFPSAAGCDSAVTLHLDITPRPSAPLAGDSITYCQDAPGAPLAAAGQNLLWYGTASGGAGSTTAPVPATDVPGIFNWYVSQTVNGCESPRAVITVRVVEKPFAAIIAGADTVCLHDTVVVHIDGGMLPDVVYDWDAGDALTLRLDGTGQASVLYATPGVKVIKLSASRGGCSTVVTYTLYIRPTPGYHLSVPEYGCVGAVMEITLDQVTDATQYSFNTGGGTLVYGDFRRLWGVRWDTPGNKEVRLNISGVCASASVGKVIGIHESPPVHMEADKYEVCEGDSIRLNAQGPATWHYQWLPESAFTGNRSPEAFAHVYQQTLLKLEVTNEYGCKAADSILIATRRCCGIFVPNAFSPNGDGKNDVFRPVGEGLKQSYTFRVYNRWGQVVFNTMQQHAGWNGTYQGVAQEPGTYYYSVRYACSDNEVYEQKGDVILVR